MRLALHRREKIESCLPFDRGRAYREATTELRVHLPDDVAARLASEAAHRGTSTEAVAADVLTQHAPPAQSSPAAPGHRFAFIGIANSGRSDLSERVEELLADDLGR